jgi:hypothetical protein
MSHQIFELFQSANKQINKSTRQNVVDVTIQQNKHAILMFATGLKVS